MVAWHMNPHVVVGLAPNHLVYTSKRPLPFIACCLLKDPVCCLKASTSHWQTQKPEVASGFPRVRRSSPFHKTYDADNEKEIMNRMR